MLAHSKLLLGLLSLAITANWLAEAQLVDGQLDVYPPGVTAAYLLRLRGFIADEFSVVTKSNYVLTITRGRNPLFSQRLESCPEPIIFIHGLFSNANNFLVNSQGAEPKDLSGIDFDSLSLEEAKSALADEPSARSLPLLALNRGCEVWLLARRGTPGSQQRLGDPLSIKATPTNATGSPFGNSTLDNLLVSATNLLNLTGTLQGVGYTLDADYWDYSLDEQSADDFPTTINFVLARSPGASRVAVVGHSNGAAITLMGLSLMSAEMRRNISVAILWAPAYATSNDNLQFNLLYGPLLPVTTAYVGPLLLPPFLSNPVIASLQTVCTPPVTWRTVCELAYDRIFGNSGGQQPMTPQIVDSFPYASSSHEFAQIIQSIFNPPNHTIRYFNSTRAYSLADIGDSPKLSFYAGATDIVVTATDVQKARDQLTVDSEYHLLGETFNHIGYFNHDESPQKVIILSMYEIQTLARMGTN